MKRFDDKVALITGAGSGIGQATAVRLAAEGARVFCVDINPAGLEATQSTIAEHGGQAFVHVCDVSDEAAIKACVEACITQWDRLDVLCNMAGILRFDNAHELTTANWQRVIAINLTGTFLMCREALPHLLDSKGNIVNAASTASLAGLPWGAAYSASKGGVLAMTRSIAVEYAKRGVRANCVCPGDIATNMAAGVTFPDGADLALLSRISSLTGMKGPEVVAGVIAMLASEDGIHITGEDIRMDGGTLS
ncbi:MAG TPA: SDR family NAD(P)-dependent oxidoreductase [Pseudomonadales bacterium]|jgi:NAD(P)-dependent dehydrogenase (short-subunit alcohol dehydrogenase family)